jgi:hypothetical protein
VWANLHGGVVLGLGSLGLLVGLEAARRVLRRPGAAPWSRVGGLGAAVALAAAAGCLNPNGPGLYRYALATSASERLKPITEWHAPDFTDPANLGLLVLIASFAVLLAMGGRISLRDAGMSIAGFAAALLAVRNTSLAVALALPAWTSLLQQAIHRWAGWRASRRSSDRSATAPRAGARARFAGAAIILVGGVAGGVTVARAATDSSPAGIATTYPACAASALRGVDGIRLVAPYFHSGYLIDQLWPQSHVFIYGESASLGLQTFGDYQRIYSGSVSLLSAHGADAVLTPRGALYDALTASPGWHRVLSDPTGLALFTTRALPGRTC